MIRRIVHRLAAKKSIPRELPARGQSSNDSRNHASANLFESDQPDDGAAPYIEGVKRGRYSGAFSRSFSPANDVDREKASAQYLDGVQSLMLPRKAPSARKHLEIN